MTVCKSKYIPRPEGNVDSETQNKNKRTNGLLKLMTKLPWLRQRQNFAPDIWAKVPNIQEAVNLTFENQWAGERKWPLDCPPDL